MKLWPAVLSALLFFIPPGAPGAEDSNGAARELARKTAAYAGKGESVGVAWRNLSSLGPSEFTQVRAAFESALKDAGGRTSEVAPFAEAHLTLSENRASYLLVEEARKGDDRQVWMASWKRAAAVSSTAPAITLEKRLVWAQDEPMLDVAFPANAMLVLAPSKVMLYTRQNGSWEPKATAAITPLKPWPHDPRGHLRVNTASFQAYLPGVTCAGTTEPSLTMDCRASDEPWALESGSRALLLANYAAARNHFDGRVTLQTGQRKTVAPFYSAASVDEPGHTLWLLAMADGRTQLFDEAFAPVGAIASWGSDIAGTDAHCSGGWQVLATRPGDGSAPDAIQAFSITARAPAPLTLPAELPGPVTALWVSGGTSAMTIVRNLVTGRYEAYVISLVCPA